jgi:hypothetical protein
MSSEPVDPLPQPEGPAVQAPVTPPAPGAAPPRRTSWRRRALTGVAVFLVIYLTFAYVFMPLWWSRYARRHPSLEDIPNITYTGDGHPGDPINVALIGTKRQLIKIMVAAKWYPADPLSLRSSLEIVEASVLKRPYDAAPVSNLYLFGRREDLAFEKPVGPDPRERHHVRFWEAPKTDPDGRPIWVGSAAFDRRVGLSHTTGQVTHHISGDVDAERDFLFKDLRATGDLSDFYTVDDFHRVREGRNGGGDRWYTDGKLYVGVINPSFE